MQLCSEARSGSSSGNKVKKGVNIFRKMKLQVIRLFETAFVFDRINFQYVPYFKV